MPASEASLAELSPASSADFERAACEKCTETAGEAEDAAPVEAAAGAEGEASAGESAAKLLSPVELIVIKPSPVIGVPNAFCKAFDLIIGPI